MLRLRLLPIVAAIALVGAACAADETAPDVPEDLVEEDAATGEDDASDDASDDVSDDASDDASARSAAGSPTSGLQVATSDLGDHIVTDEGMTTYAAVDQPDGEVVCVADCAQVWPPVIAEGELSVGDGIDPELVTTITLDDGREQVTVAGAALHTFVVDAAPGDVRGQRSADRWFVVSPAGALVGVPGE